MQMRELEMCGMRVSFSSTNAGCLYHRLSPLYQGGTKARTPRRESTAGGGLTIFGEFLILKPRRSSGVVASL
jgi:hypothetical protein